MHFSNCGALLQEVSSLTDVEEKKLSDSTDFPGMLKIATKCGKILRNLSWQCCTIENSDLDRRVESGEFNMNNWNS